MDKQHAQMTDEELALLVQGGDENAFGALMDRYQPKLLRYGKKFLSSDDLVVDSVQDVFIKTYQNMRSFDATRKFSSWIYRIAHNTFVNVLRDKERDPIMYLDIDALVGHAAEDHLPDAYERERMKALLEKGLGAITPAYREVLVLYYLEDLSYQEIADVLRVPIGTVGVRLRRARDMLRRTLGAERYEDL